MRGIVLTGLVAGAVVLTPQPATASNWARDVFLHDESSATLTWLFGPKSSDVDVAFRAYGLELGGSFEQTYDDQTPSSSNRVMIGISPVTLGSWWFSEEDHAHDIAYVQPFVHYAYGNLRAGDSEQPNESWTIGARAWWGGPTVFRLGVQAQAQLGNDSRFNDWSMGFLLGTGNYHDRSDGSGIRIPSVVTTVASFAVLMGVAALAGAVSDRCEQTMCDQM